MNEIHVTPTSNEMQAKEQLQKEINQRGENQ